jgi:hypothetical protein
MRTLMLTLVFAVFAAPLAAQHTQHDPDDKVAGGGELPSGWHARPDKANASMADVKFVSMGDGYHATLGPAAIFYNPAHNATGAYRAQATFTQTKAPQHPEAYGLVIGGKNLDKDNQDYLYFLVRQDGKFLVKHRAGTETHTLFEWTEHPAIRKADAEGKATNALAVDVGADGVRFLVNGTQVAQMERAADLNTDGIVGLRINHNLDVHVSDFGVSPATRQRAGR